MTSDEINEQFKSEYVMIQAKENTVGFISKEEELRLSEWYKTEHQKIISNRRVIEQQVNNNRTCEVCFGKIPIKRGRAPKRCGECDVRK